MTPTTPFLTLFLCTGNSARSVFAEYFLREIGGPRFEVFSAGSHPKGAVNPYTIRVLNEVFHLDTTNASSKSWDQFQQIDLDFVITVCDSARETCPVFPGQPVTAHWGFEDPAAFEGPEDETFRKFRTIAFSIRRRIELFASLPIEKLDHLRLEHETRRLGTLTD